MFSPLAVLRLFIFTAGPTGARPLGIITAVRCTAIPAQIVKRGPPGLVNRRRHFGLRGMATLDAGSASEHEDLELLDAAPSSSESSLSPGSPIADVPCKKPRSVDTDVDCGEKAVAQFDDLSEGCQSVSPEFAISDDGCRDHRRADDFLPRTRQQDNSGPSCIYRISERGAQRQRGTGESGVNCDGEMDADTPPLDLRLGTQGAGIPIWVPPWPGGETPSAGVEAAVAVSKAPTCDGLHTPEPASGLACVVGAIFGWGAAAVAPLVSMTTRPETHVRQLIRTMTDASAASSLFDDLSEVSDDKPDVMVESAVVARASLAVERVVVKGVSAHESAGTTVVGWSCWWARKCHE